MPPTPSPRLSGSLKNHREILYCRVKRQAPILQSLANPILVTLPHFNIQKCVRCAQVANCHILLTVIPPIFIRTYNNHLHSGHKSPLY